tara:strand:- start:3090 stop:3464 length:375 start_codon:yes stop_codon:yes gene_type:complete
MSLSYKESLENYSDFYITIRNELREENIFHVVTELNILDKFLKENLISEEFHKKNLQRCIKVDKENMNKELFSGMLISSILISGIYCYFVPYNQYLFLKICMLFYLLIIYYLSFKYFKLILKGD